MLTPNHFYMHNCSYYFAYRIKNGSLHNFELLGIKSHTPHKVLLTGWICAIYSTLSQTINTDIYIGEFNTSE